MVEKLRNRVSWVPSPLMDQSPIVVSHALTESDAVPVLEFVHLFNIRHVANIYHS